MGRKYYMGTTFVDCKKIVYENKVMENPKNYWMYITLNNWITEYKQ